MSVEIHKLVNEHLYLVRDFLRLKIKSDKLPRSIDKDDLYQEGVIALIRAARRYKLGPASFATYADKCIRPHIIGYIGDQRWGPKKAQRHRDKQNGKPLFLDMVSYDAIPLENHEDIDDLMVKIGANLGGKYSMRITADMLERILKGARLLKKAKIDKRNKHGFNGVHYGAAEKKYQAELVMCGHKFKIGGYKTPQEAGIARAEFIERLETFCLERLSKS